MRRELREALQAMERDGRVHEQRTCMQHGTTSVYRHSVNVADVSLTIADKLQIKVDREAMLRGALLHDYFLYDWHDKDNGRSLHGFYHAKEALKNAREDFALSEIEENTIERHMFPLTLTPPTCREAWIVCVADKYCAVYETLQPVWKRLGRRKG